ncbi:MAG: 1-deoxy-D-xylulose-5-phosphate synthase [Muribaculaceae bacterium]|nr:1-deoxy-D-xylulose-5-phosphate synthase [Muribaculaceae bacterium]
MYLEKISTNNDLKSLSTDELNSLSDEIRHYLLKKLSEHGGHIGPNLGFVEPTIALHYVFNSPSDKFVFDVSHQSYTHKILTGRKEAFMFPDKYDDVSGYTEPSESAHDFFTIGHTSTSVSLACGLAKARDVKGDKENIIAVIGDGSLSGGEAFEGLNNAAELGTNMIIIVNDNQMSIAENAGGMYRNLKELRDSNGNAPCNFFKAMGLDYRYVADGNNITDLIKALNEVKDCAHPVVVHINTLKGKGYAPAEAHKEAYHWGFPFDIATGESKVKFDDDYSDFFANFILDKIKTDPAVVAITSATPIIIGFTPELRKLAGKHFVDVGIAEEHAVAFASGIAKNGGKPFYGVYSTFIQRAYDQLSQDLAINNNPAVINVFMGSLAGMTDVTHLGFFDIPLISNIPNIVYLAPTCKEEYLAMLEWSYLQNSHPVVIRVPSNVVISGKTFDTDYNILNKYQIDRNGSKIAILALGGFYQLGETVADALKENHGIDATLINPRFITGTDNEMLEMLKANHSVVITLEDGVLDGGFGEKISRYYGNSDMKVLNFGAKKEFVDRFDVNKFFADNHLTVPQIVADTIQLL